MGGPRGSDKVSGLPIKSQKYRVSRQYLSKSPEKSQSYQASQMSLHWLADDGPFIVVIVWILSPFLKKDVKVGPSLTKISESMHGIALQTQVILKYYTRSLIIE